MTVDVLAIGAHADDADLGVGGTLLRLADAGHTTAILDLTRGERASRGTVEERAAEAAEAGRRLGLALRENADLPDGGVANTEAQQRVLVAIIRRLRPKVILAHSHDDRHPDHRQAHHLTRDANFFAGLASIETEDEAYRAPTIVYFHPYYESPEAPGAVMDISDVFERKLEALRAFTSQLYNESYKGKETLVSSKGFWDGIQTRAAYWGMRIGAPYGEPLFTEGPIALSTLPGLGPLP